MNAKTIIISLCILGIAVLSYVALFSSIKKNTLTRGCDREINFSELSVQGDSMSGIFENNDTARLMRGYYTCHIPQRNDIVVFSSAAHANPLVKIVKGIPGDTLSLETKPDGTMRYIIINGERIENSKNIPYQLDERAARMLQVYIDSYHGAIPPSAYLLLGNQPYGSLDSTRVGLVDVSQFIGKVVW